jgi:hypothetical protein
MGFVLFIGDRLKYFFLVFSFYFLNARAQTQLSCWHLFSKAGSAPLLVATIGAQNSLMVTLDLNSETFLNYQFDETGYQGKNHVASVLVQPAGVLKPELNTSNHSPYKGNNEYTVVYGHTLHEYFDKSDKGQLLGRLILPTNLSNSFLKNYRIRSLNERSNSVFITRPPLNTNQGGDVFLRLFCVSR